jgi:hypothetical protein
MVIKELLVVPEKMDDEERRILPICIAKIRIVKWDHDGDSCCGGVSSAETSSEEQEWTMTVPWNLRVESDDRFRVRPELCKDGQLLKTEETVDLFEAWEEGIGHRCYEKGRCGQCTVTDKYEVLEIRVVVD